MQIKLKPQLEISWLTKKARSLFLSVIIIPLNSPENFLDLSYSKGESNIVHFEKNLKVEVKKSASPLFYKLPEIKKIKSIVVKGRVNVVRPINKAKDDAYFQLGVIYKGDYRPNSFVKMFLPKWLTTVLSLHEEHGVGQIDFHEVSAYGKKLDRKEQVRGVSMHFKTQTLLMQDRSFVLEVTPRDKEVLGFWLRSDGDDSKAEFKLTLSSMIID